MKSNELAIDIVKYIKNGKTKKIFSLTGRPFGYEQRQKHDLNNIEDSYEKVTVNIPNNIIIISSSFFLGMFGASVRKCITVEKFKEKYAFNHNGKLNKNIEDGINDALNDENILE